MRNHILHGEREPFLLCYLSVLASAIYPGRSVFSRGFDLRPVGLASDLMGLSSPWRLCCGVRRCWTQRKHPGSGTESSFFTMRWEPRHCAMTLWGAVRFGCDSSASPWSSFVSGSAWCHHLSR